MPYSPVRLLDSLYWTVVTFTTTGYGDIKPKSKAGMIYASIVMIVGRIFIGYKIGLLAGKIANSENLRSWYEGQVHVSIHASLSLLLPLPFDCCGQNNQKGKLFKWLYVTRVKTINVVKCVFVMTLCRTTLCKFVYQIFYLNLKQRFSQEQQQQHESYKHLLEHNFL